MLEALICRMRLAFLRFTSDPQGQVALTFSLAALPMLAIAGSAIDYSRSVATRSNLQQATDSTVLAMTHSYLGATSTSLTLMQPTQTFLTGAMGTASPGTTAIVTANNGRVGSLGAATVTSITLGQNNTEMCITSSEIIPTYMMSIFNQKYVAVSASACSRTANTYEIALALDNSGSMNNSAGGASKMDSLKTAAAQLVDILIPSATTTSVAMSVVPFTALVNVGTSRTAKFLDTAGASSIHWQNFHRPAKATFLPLSKFELFDAIPNADWAGCVEERASPNMTTDISPSTSNADTLFVPFFAPDDPGPKTSGSYDCWPDSSCANPIDTSTASGHNHVYTNSYITDGGSGSAGSCPTSKTATTGDSLYYQWDNAASQQADGKTTLYPGAGVTMLCKYNGASVLNTGSSGSVIGPNNGCPAAKITPLNNTSSTIKTAINAMSAGGSTNLTSGFMWGWRSISPTVNPFPVAAPTLTGPQNPKSYTQTSPLNQKIIIFMTDGYNSYGLSSTGSNPLYFNNFTPNKSDYEGFGYFVNDRLSAYYSQCNVTSTSQSSYRCLMDAATLEACNNARSAGVIVYTIGFSVSGDPIDDQGKALLQSCARSPNYYYPATDSASIQSAFRQIAQSILSLRLSN